MCKEGEQLVLFDLGSSLGKTCPALSAREPRRGRTSGSSSKKSAKLIAIPFLSLDLTPGHGNLLGESYWELLSPWLGGSWTLNTGVSPREGRVSSLSQILEDSPPRKYYLSRKACLGILRRARERGKPLPPQLEAALKAQAGLTVYLTPLEPPLAFHMNQRDEAIDLGETAGALMATNNMQMQTFVTAFATNQRDEVRDLHDVAGALSAQPGVKQQTYVAGCLNPWDTQQTRVFTPEGTAPTLAGADGCGGRNPGGLVFDADEAEPRTCLTPWDTQQARITTPGGVSPTINSGEAKPGGRVFAAGFCAGAGPSAGGIGYHEELAPTLKGSSSGNMMPSVLCMGRPNGAPAQTQRSGLRGERRSGGMSEPPPSGGGEGYGACDDAMMPSVLCLNDQGGRVMECSEDISGTLRAQEHGHQPLIFENHGIDARYTGPHKVAPTLSARAGTGGNNLSLVMQEEEPVFCITGNAIDRQPENGGNGLGVQEDIAYTLTATDHHAVFARQRCDKFQEGGVASTQSSRQQKEATDLIYQETVGTFTSSDSKGPNAQYVSQDKLIVEAPLLIRRLTPRECERLQGYPDDWTALPGAADSPRYRALGNSVAIPCVEYLMHGMALVLKAG